MRYLLLFQVVSYAIAGIVLLTHTFLYHDPGSSLFWTEWFRGVVCFLLSDNLLSYMKDFHAD